MTENQPSLRLSPPLPVRGQEPDDLSMDHLRANLDARTVRGAAVTITAQAIQVALGVGTTVVLARLLTPQDFGLLAMVATLTGFVATFKDFGLPMAAVHKAEIDHAQVSRLFWVNLKLSLLVAVFLTAMAPVLAWFYGEPRLVGITLALTAGIAALGPCMVHAGLLRRQMRFGVLTMIEVGSQAAGGIVGIGSALAGAGFWALVLQQLAVHVVQAGTLWLTCPWRPAGYRVRPSSPDDGLSSMLSYGRHVTYARVATYLGRNFDLILVGRFAGTVSLGLYHKAFQWSLLLFQQLYSPLLNVVVASFSRVQHDPDRYRALARQALLALFAGTLPAMTFMLVKAQDVILLLLGEQWLEAVPLFQILTLAALAGSAGHVTKWLYLSEGQTERMFRWTLISTPVMLAGVALGVCWGVTGVAVGYTTAVCVLSYPAVRFCLQTSPIPAREFWGAWCRPAAGTLAAAAGLLVLEHLDPLGPSSLYSLARAVGLFLLIYTGYWLATRTGRRDLRGILTLFRLLRADGSRSN